MSPETTLTRRRLIGLAAASAAAIPLGGLWRPGPAAAGDPIADAYQRAFAAMIGDNKDVRWYQDARREILYRPRQVLVADADARRVIARLRKMGLPVTGGGEFAGVTVLLFDREVDVPAVVDVLRDPDQWPGERVPGVQPHHVLLGFGKIMGNPDGPPTATGQLPARDPARGTEGAGVTVGICDTGIWRDAAAAHPDWLGGSYVPEADDEDSLYTYGDVLALEGGHGTFVAGVVRQAAPGVRFDPERALEASGLGDEASLVAALGRLGSTVSVINLSLGGYTLGDVPPLPLVNALAALPAGVVTVAAAGNAGSTRPTWPAALGPVVAVAATATGETGPQPASYSNYGPWVDAWAPGTWTSTFVKGRRSLPGVPDEEFGGVAGWSGTSFAAAYVSGRLAAQMTAGGLSADEARLRLLAGQPAPFGDGVLVE
ncbi:S8 family serine peptidase [Actinoplanes sp. KI2]|uniref:S8 family peptidase n=1 Tax=Actinoplanes sp. KI2 TaxID=2983315 RepID=UPI0021D57E59|nr:S8 family serine peptidase [Actinoplanes sp. KI2]MCU7722885.1 S8 family serine peptidase [Actinoplanes sp. KI2]